MFDIISACKKKLSELQDIYIQVKNVEREKVWERKLGEVVDRLSGRRDGVDDGIISSRGTWSNILSQIRYSLCHFTAFTDQIATHI